jgi:hypothetical protein
MGSGTTEVSSLMFLLDPHDSLLQVGSAYLQSGVRHILLTKADSCSRCMFISQKNSFYLNLISLIHRAGFILSLAHLGIFISLRSAIFTLHFSFFAQACPLCSSATEKARTTFICLTKSDTFLLYSQTTVR